MHGHVPVLDPLIWVKSGGHKSCIHLQPLQLLVLQSALSCLSLPLLVPLDGGPCGRLWVPPHAWVCLVLLMVEYYAVRSHGHLTVFSCISHSCLTSLDLSLAHTQPRKHREEGALCPTHPTHQQLDSSTPSTFLSQTLPHHMSHTTEDTIVELQVWEKQAWLKIPEAANMFFIEKWGLDRV